jgi:uncharacterized protein YjiS (DUF1127 family)
MQLSLSPRLPRSPHLRRAAAQLAGLIAAHLRAIEARRALARMDDRMLSDIGISRTQAEFGANRKSWNQPK